MRRRGRGTDKASEASMGSRALQRHGPGAPAPGSGPAPAVAGAPLSMLIKAVVCFTMGAILMASSQPWWLFTPVGIALQGLALVWFELVEKDCEHGSVFTSEVLNLGMLHFLKWRLHTALWAVLAITGTRGLWWLLIFWFLPLAAMQATFSVLGSAELAGNEDVADAPSGGGMPHSTLVTVTTEAVAEILGVKPSAVRPDAALMDLGMDSPMALRLQELLSRRLAVELPSSFLFNYPTVNAMVDHGLRGRSSRTPALAEGGGMGSGPAALAITSAACDLPGSNDLEALWTALASCMDSVVEVPLGRWDHSEYYAAELQEGRTYTRHGGFLEGAHLFDAAAFSISAPEAQAADPQQRLLLSTAYSGLRGAGYDRGLMQETPVGVYVALSNLDWYQMSVPASGAYAGTGVASAIAANRISYAFSLRGPSFAVDTACSSSLAALGAAVAGFAAGHVASEALVGASELMHGPNAFILRSITGMLSKVGRCKTFNATADGYARAEGCGVLLLKPLVEAENHHCRIIARLGSVALNQNGKSATLTAPNGSSQQEVLVQALRDARLRPPAVGCVECHGTGTPLGDPVEASALQAVLGGASTPAPELLLGAVKSNMGHLEAAAGFAGLMKAFCCLQQCRVPPNVHFASMNPHIAVSSSRLVVPQSVKDLVQPGAVMGVSSFGFGGTNAHTLLHQMTAAQPQTPADSRVAFLFTGQGVQRVGMGKRLYQTDAAFHRALDSCAQLCEPWLPEKLVDIMFDGDAPTAGKLDSPLYSQVATFCLEYALSEMWRARGVTPYAVLGHSLGEYVAAVVAGIMSLKDALNITMARGKLLEDKCDPTVGAMAAVRASRKEAERTIARTGLSGGAVVVAAVNEPQQTVISGQKKAVEAVCSKVPAGHAVLSIPHAMHSPLLAPILPDLRKVLESCEFREPSKCRFVSCLLGAEATAELQKPQYWLGHDEARPVLFMQGLEALEHIGCATFLELGPQPTLVKLARRCLRQQDCELFASMEQGCDEAETVVLASRALGVAFDRPSDLRPLPFPWATPLLHPLLGARHEEGETVAFKSEATMAEGMALRLFVQHRVLGQTVLPGASHLLLAAAAQLSRRPQGDGSYVELADTVFERPFIVPDGGGVHTICRAATDHTEVTSCTEGAAEVVHARIGDCHVAGGPGSHGAAPWHCLEEWRGLCGEPRADMIDGLYTAFKDVGLSYGPSFQTLRACAFCDTGAFAWLGAPISMWERSLQLLHPALLDGALQLLVHCATQKAEKSGAYLPFIVKRAIISARCPPGPLWASARVLHYSEESVTGDIEVVSADGQLAARLQNVICRRAKIPKSGITNAERCLYSVEWAPIPSRINKTCSADGVLVSGSNQYRQALLLALGAPEDACTFAETTAAAVPLLSGRRWVAVAYLASGGQIDALEDAVRLLQALAALGAQAPPLILATVSVQPVGLTSEEHSPVHAGLWGLARSARLEFTELRVQCVDLTEHQTSTVAPDASGPVLGLESEASIRGGQLLSAQLAQSSLAPTWPQRLQLAKRGSLSNLSAECQLQRRMPSQGDLELRVGAVGLNFRDVLNVMGVYPGDPGEPGLDCSGVVVAVGAEPGMEGLSCGQAAFGIVWGCLCTYAVGKTQLLAPRPSGWQHAQAASLPTVYTTVDMAFAELAKLRRTDRVLVHAATGGVGLVAVQYAQKLGAIVYATAGSEEKRAHLRSLGVEYVSTSRNGAEFEGEMRAFLGQERLDVVLNSLSHDDYIGRSMGLLRDGGRFVEIGKRDVWTPEKAAGERPDVRYHLLALDTICEREPERFQGLLRRLETRMRSGGWGPLPLQAYEGLGQGVAALQFLRRARHIGKVVLTLPSRMGLHEDAAYVLSGGMGALGLMTARAMVEEGGQRLVLLSRSGRAAAGAREHWEWLQASNVQVMARVCDIAGYKSLAATASPTTGNDGVEVVVQEAVGEGKITVTVPKDATFQVLKQAVAEHLGRDEILHKGRCMKKKGGVYSSYKDTELLEDVRLVLVLGAGLSAAAEAPAKASRTAAPAAEVAPAALALLQRLQCELGAPVRGLLHLAGVLDDGTIPQLTRAHFEAVFGPKVGGARLLQEAFAGAPLDFIVLFSSTAALLGAAGQANYAAANACLDAMAHNWQLKGKPACSVQWGPWLGAGMAVERNSFGRLRQAGLKSDLSMAVLSSIIGGPQVGPCVIGCALVQWSGFLKQFARTPRFFAQFQVKDAAVSRAKPSEAGALAAPKELHVAGYPSVHAWVEAVAARIVGAHVAVDDPLMAAGLDSLSAVEFRRQLMTECPRVRFPSTLIFDHPTVRSIAKFAKSRFAPVEPATEAAIKEAPWPAEKADGQRPSTLSLACRLPGGSSLESAWSRWLGRHDAVTEVPLCRFDYFETFDPDPEAIGNVTYARHGAFIEGTQLFDPHFFGMSPSEAKAIDPQQRQTLEVSYEAFHSAGRSKKMIKDMDIGVFVGQCHNDWAKIMALGQREAGPFTGPGTHSSMSANRVSYCLGFHGISTTVDTACSSALVALDLALGRLSVELLKTALCTGCQLNLSAEPFVSFAKSKMLSIDGRCKTFDASANGFVRGEGIGAILLEVPSADRMAKARRAAVAETAANQDGRSSSLTAPHGPSQQAVIRRVLEQGQLEGAAVGAVECHGTGTALGDPIEVGALRAVLSEGRSTPLIMGTVKTNCGHLEGAAGAAGLLKAILALEHQEMPPHLHLAKVNTYIDLENFPVIIPTAVKPLKLERLVLGLSSFGFGGTNAHASIQEAPAGEDPAEEEAKAKCRVAFLFTGMGSQYNGMGSKLYKAEESFRKTLDRCAALLDPLLPVPLLDVVFNRDESHTGLLDKVHFSQPAIFALECALADMWRTKGVEPSAVLGHGIGEYAAAVAAGVMSLEDGAKLIAARSRLMVEKCEADVGEMMVLHASEQTVAAVIEELEPEEREQVSIAVVNGPALVVVSGRGEIVRRVAEQTGASSQQLPVSHAFNSPLMGPMLEDFRAALQKVQFSHPEKCAFVSTLTGQVAEEELQDPEYWVRHVSQAICFTKGMACVASLGADVFLEIGPKPLLVTMGKRCIPAGDFQWLSSVESQAAVPGAAHPSIQDMVAVLRGGLAPLRYQCQPFRWAQAPPRMVRRRGGEGKEAHFDVPLADDLLVAVSRHAVFGRAMVPCSFFLEMVLEACCKFLGAGAHVCNLQMSWPLVLPASASCEEAQVKLRLAVIDRATFELRSQAVNDEAWTTHCYGNVEFRERDIVAVKSTEPAFLAAKARCQTPVDAKELYSQIESIGLSCDPQVHALQELHCCEGEAVCKLQLPAAAIDTNYVVHPALIEGTVHAAFALMLGEKPVFPRVFAGVGRVAATHHEVPQGKPLLLHLRMSKQTDLELTLACTVCSEDLVLLLEMEDVVLRRISPSQMRKTRQPTEAMEKLSLFEVEWVPVPGYKNPPVEDGDRWLVVVEGDPELLNSLSEQLGLKTDTVEQQEASAQDGKKIAVEKAQDASRTSESGSDDADKDGEKSEEEWEGHLCVDTLPDDTDAYGKLMYVASSNASSTQALSKAAELLKRLLRFQKDGETVPEVWFVLQDTEAAQVEDLFGKGVPKHAGLWGLARCCRLEHPQLKLGCVDVSTGEGISNLVRTLMRVRSRQGGFVEREILVRDVGDRGAEQRVARLLEKPLPSQSSWPDSLFSSTGTYAMTGGTGSLGLLFARWMAEQGAGHLALLSRRGAASVEMAPTLQKLVSMDGLEVCLRTCDVSEQDEVACCFKDLQDSMPAIRGVIHAAGVLDFRLIESLEVAHVVQILGPKIDGATNLHDATVDLDLDLFLLLSSVTAVLGSPGQSSSCAGNVFLDSFAKHRRAHGFPAMSIQWGPWAAPGPQQRITTLDSCFPRVEPSAALAALGAVLGSAGGPRGTAVGLACVNWPGLLALMPLVPPHLRNFEALRAKGKGKGKGKDKNAEPGEGKARMLNTRRQMSLDIMNSGSCRTSMISSMGRMGVAGLGLSSLAATLPRLAVGQSGGGRKEDSDTDSKSDLDFDAGKPAPQKIAPKLSAKYLAQLQKQHRDTKDVGGPGMAANAAASGASDARSPRQLQQKPSGMAPPVEKPSLFEVQWAPAKDVTEGFGVESGQWLVLAEGDAELLQELKGQLGEEHSYVKSLPEDMQEISRFSKVVFVASAAVAAVDVLEGAVRVLKRLIRLHVRMQRTRQPTPEVWFVLRHTQATALEDLKGTDVPKHAGLWGLARCIRLERPGITIGSVNLNLRETGVPAMVKMLRSVRTKHDGTTEPEIVVRLDGQGGTEVYIGRLAEVTSTVQGTLPPEGFFRGEKTFLLTGGTGALGLVFGRWMADRGAAHLALLSRSGKAPDDAAAILEELSVREDLQLAVHECDVRSAEGLTTCLMALRKAMPPLKGLVHAAGVVDDHMFEYLERPHLEAVLGPKMDGALNLHMSSSNDGLDFFILFSSVAAMVGSPGQANYCAANSFLDSLALHRRAQGLPATSVQWGPWASLGMAERAGTPESRFYRLEPRACLAAFGTVLGSGGSLRGGVVGISRINWTGVFARMTRVPPYLDNFRHLKEEAKGQAEARPPLTGQGMAFGGLGAGPALLSSLGFAAQSNGRGISGVPMSAMLGLSGNIMRNLPRPVQEETQASCEASPGAVPGPAEPASVPDRESAMPEAPRPAVPEAAAAAGVEPAAKPTQAEMPKEKRTPSFFEVEWLSAPDATEKFVTENQRLLVLSDGDSELSRELCQELGEGHCCMGEVPEEPQALAAFSKVVLVASPRASSMEVLGGALQALKRVIKLQMRLQRMRKAVPEVWCVTRYTQAVCEGDLKGAEVPKHAGLWGLTRCLRLERPGLAVGCLDVGTSKAEVAALAHALRAAHTRSQGGAFESELAVREGAGGEAAELRVARLVERALEVKDSLPKTFFAGERTFVLTGGTGALGLLTACWMKGHGAQHLALLSRSNKPPQDAAPILGQLLQLRGLQIVRRACDVQVEGQVAACLEGLKDAAPPVRGLVHAAGFLEDHMFEYLEQHHLGPVLGPKIDGSLNLHTTTCGTELDFFVMFSSAASMIGSPAQANYGAANSFMDSFARYRRAQDLPAASVQWGPWGALGMAERAGTPESRFYRIDPTSSLFALGMVLEGASSLRSPVVGIARVNWTGLFGRLQAVPAYLRNFEDKAGTSKAASARPHVTSPGLLGVGLLPSPLSRNDSNMPGKTMPPLMGQLSSSLAAGAGPTAPGSLPGLGPRVGGGMMPASSLLPGFSTGSLSMPPVQNHHAKPSGREQAEPELNSEHQETGAAEACAAEGAKPVETGVKADEGAGVQATLEISATEAPEAQLLKADVEAGPAGLAEPAAADAAAAESGAGAAVPADSAAPDQDEAGLTAATTQAEAAGTPPLDKKLQVTVPQPSEQAADRARFSAQDTKDELKFYGIQWFPVSATTDQFMDNGQRLLVLAEGDPELLQELQQEMGDDHAFASDVPEDPQEFTTFSKVVFVAAARVAAVDVLAGALRVLKRVIRMQMRLQRMRKPVPQVWFVLQHTQAARLEDLRGREVPKHAGLWGLARCLRLERLGLIVGCVDVGACKPGAAALVHLLKSVRIKQEDAVETEIVVQDMEDQGAVLHVPRLVEALPQGLPSLPEFFFSGEQTYVVSGGTGALGVLSARWMADQGARNLALLSRSGRPPQDAAAVFEQLMTLASAQVMVCECDIQDEAHVTSCFKRLQRSMPPVRGVLHAAGRLDDHMFEYLEREHLAPVLGPKVEGALNLHTASADANLDFFVMFSSVAAMVGSPGQANYAAANAFLDAFSLHRRAQGLVASSIQWGPWASMGMSARSGIPQNRFVRVDPVTCLDALGAVLASSDGPSSGIRGIGCINWPGFFGRMQVVPAYLKNFEKFKEERPSRELPAPSGIGASRRTPPLLGGFGSLGRGSALSAFAMNPLVGLGRPSLLPRGPPQGPMAATVTTAREESSSESSSSAEA